MNTTKIKISKRKLESIIPHNVAVREALNYRLLIIFVLIIFFIYAQPRFGVKFGRKHVLAATTPQRRKICL